MMSDERLFEQIPETVSVLDADLTVRTQNRRSRETHGTVAGRPCFEAHFGRSSRCPGCGVEGVLKHRTSDSWFLTDGRSDRPSHYEVSMAPLLDSNGRLEGLIEVIRDATVSLAVEGHLIHTSEQLEAEVTRRRRELDRLAERFDALQRDQTALVQTEKMASVGRLAAGLTHEIHTPLGALLSNSDLLRRCLERLENDLEQAGEGLPPTLRAQIDNGFKLLDLQQGAGRRLARILRSLRTFAHLDRAEEEDYDIHEGIEAGLALLTHETKGRIELLRDYGEIPPVRCRPDAINQVFMGLLENAVQAIEGEGTIRIWTGVDRDEVVVKIQDNGKGIAPEHLEKVLEPGFTTKPRGVGTGLGLAIAHQTIISHGGAIEVSSDPGRQTIFTLRLPISP